MYRWFFSGMDTNLPLLAMFVFLILFFAALVRLFVFKSRADFARLENLPLSEDAHEKGVSL